MKTSITTRLVGLFVVLGAAVFAASGAWLYHYIDRSLMQQISDELAFRHSMLDPMLSKSGNTEQWETVRRKLTELGGSDSRMRYWVMSDNPLYTFGSGPAIPDWLGKPEGTSIIRRATDDKTWIIFTRTIPALGERPEVRFVTVSDCTLYFKTLERFRNILILSYVFALFVLALLAYVMTRVGLAPLHRLSAQARNLPTGDVGRRLDVQSLPSELCELANAFNGALARQEAAWRQLESFNANVAHELRTPLSNLMGQTQVMLTHKRSVEELEALLASNLEEIDRLTAIVNDMLFLSVAGSGRRAADLSEVSLRQETLKTLDYLEPLLTEHEQSVEVFGDANIRVDRRLFHRALGNLLQNAARHTEVGERIVVSITEQKAAIEVAVCNPGPPIADDIATRLFERFYRADTARTASDLHHGLGLSIVAAVAHMHGGTARYERQQHQNAFIFSMATHHLN